MVALQSSFMNASFAAKGGYGYESNIFISTWMQTLVHMYMHLCEYAHTHTNRHINLNIITNTKTYFYHISKARDKTRLS
jgi:hypothetical protein